MNNEDINIKRVLLIGELKNFNSIYLKHDWDTDLILVGSFLDAITHIKDSKKNSKPFTRIIINLEIPMMAGYVLSKDNGVALLEEIERMDLDVPVSIVNLANSDKSYVASFRFVQEASA